ncbi:MAG: DUF4352 domain-containing protein, partial [Candidatus Promineifilaceae bacterium]
LALLALACGSEEAPTKVGAIAPNGDAAATQPAEEDASEPDEPQAEEPTAEAEDVEPAASLPTLTTFKPGDIVSLGDTVMVVLGWSSLAGDDFSSPEPGAKFVAVDVLFVNQGADSSSISTLLQTTLKDDTNQGYDVDLSAAIASGKSGPDGELVPGERLRGTVGFQVPERAQGLVFVFDGDIFGSGKVFVELGPEPVALEPPAELLGERQVPTSSIGEAISLGDLVLTVNGTSSPEGDDFNRPDEGFKFLVVDFSLANQGSTAESVSSLLQTSIKDATGQEYDIDLMASVAGGGSTPDGEIAAGETIRGQVGFQVPADATDLVFVFDAEVFGQGKVFVDLTS